MLRLGQALHRVSGPRAVFGSADTRLAALVALLNLGVNFSLSVAIDGSRWNNPTRDTHYATLARTWLGGSLHLKSGRPPGLNDWACFDRRERRACPPNFAQHPNPDPGRFRWYVSFPPAPAVLLLPWAWLSQRVVAERVLWTFLASCVPALLFLLLRGLQTRDLAGGTRWQALGLSLLYAFGTPHFFNALFIGPYGTPSAAAHVVAELLLSLFLLTLLHGQSAWTRGAGAGLLIGAATLSRPTMVFFAPLGLAAVLAQQAPSNGSWRQRLWSARRALLAFVVGMAALLALAAWHNAARFGSPLEFGHRFLDVYQRVRIERWGLFSYHYLARNLAVWSSSLPWILDRDPWIRIPGDGLALWLSSPFILWALWPAERTRLYRLIGLCVLPAVAMNLLYQNTGRAQFAYRFALDYLLPVTLLLLIGRVRLGRAFWAAGLAAVAINAFGALTFGSSYRYYDFGRSETAFLRTSEDP